MKIKNKISILLVLVATIFGAVAATFDFARADPVKQISVSAYLTGNQNKEVDNGDYEVRFAFYKTDRTAADPYPSNADSASRVWEETQKVKIVNGIMSAYLGSVTPFPDALSFNDGDYFLGIRIGTDSEMVPRKKVAAAPIAVNSLFLRGATIGTGAGNIPVLGSGGKLDVKIMPKVTNLGVVSSGTWEGDALASGFGGTGLTSYAAGDMLYASAKDELAALAIGASGQFLSIAGGIPAWATLNLSAPGEITSGTWHGDVIETAYGGTNATAIGDAGSIAYSNGTAYSFSDAGAGGEVLLSGGAGAPVWGTVSGGVISPDSLDFTELADAMTLDNDLTIDTNGFDFNVDGTLSADSLIISGQATLGTLGLNLYTNTSFIPETDGLNLGSSSNHWADLYVDNLSVGGTDMNGTTSEYFSINTDSVSDEDMGLRFYRSPLNGYAALVWDAADTQFNLYKRENTSELADLSLNNLYAKGNVGIGTASPGAKLEVAQTATATGALKGLIYTGAVNTNQTASTEIPSLTLTTAGRQWATGALATQREVLITAPTYSFVGASTITDAATLAIAGAPIKSTNATITNTHGLLIQAGAVSTATNSYGLTVNAQTGATNNYAAAFLGGNVGIRTASPGDMLDVGSTSLSGNIRLSAASNGQSNIDFYDGSIAGRIQYTHSSNGMSFYTDGTRRLTIQSDGNVGIGIAVAGAKLEVAQTATATGALKGIIYTGAVNTNQTASTEIPSLTLTTAGRQWATGALATQREVLITAPTYSFVGASTITDAATLAIAGAPIKSANASITNTHGLLIQAGAVSTATNSYGLTVNAQTGATNNYAAAFLGGNVGIGMASPLAGLDVQKAITAASGVAYGTRLQQTLTAAANSDTLSALYINPTFTNGSYTGVSNNAILVGNGLSKLTDLYSTNHVLPGYAATTLSAYAGFTGYTNLSGGLGTGNTDSVLGAQRITSYGNLVNIGSIQAGEAHLRSGGTFAAKADYTAGTDPMSISIGDVNGDGKNDLAVANANSTTVSVFLNNGNGTFAAKADYTTGTYPRSVSIGEVNGDGKNDLAVANYSSNTVSVLFNNGNGTFAAKADYTAGSGPWSISIGEVNGDGKNDLAVANNGSATVSVFLNNGNGTFAAKADYTTGTNPRSVSIGDVNGDGKNDLAVANNGSATVSVFLNNGNGTFAAKADYTTGTYPRSVSIGDVNGDGKNDLAVANEDSTTVSVFLNNGNGTFAAKADYTAGSGPWSISIGDVNGDGKNDLAVTNAGSNTVSVLFNNGNGTFAAKADYAAGSLPYSVSIGDVNGDGKNDLAVANFNSDTVSVFINNATTIFYAQASSGNVGIGTASPTTKLHIQDDIAGSVTLNLVNQHHEDETSYAYLKFQGGYSATDVTTMGGIAAGKEQTWTSTAATRDGYLDFYTVLDGTLGTSKMRITSNGNVGIGTDTPNNTIQVKDLINFDNTARRGTFLGYQAGNVNTGTWNAFVGYQTGYSNTSGMNNAGIGYQALFNNLTGYHNSALGQQALFSNTEGVWNVAIGSDCLWTNTTGDGNTAIGYGALVGANAIGNIAIGYRAGESITTGANNIVIGYDIDAPLNDGSNQMTIGNLIFATGIDGTGKTISSGNVGIGTSAPNNTIQVADLINFDNTTASTFLGYQAGNVNTGNWNSFIGYQAGLNNTTGDYNSAVGAEALYSSTTGDYNSAMGMDALSYNTTGHSNSAVGTQVLDRNTTGYENSAMGRDSLFFNTTGYRNSAMGMQALLYTRPTSKAITAFANNGAGGTTVTSADHGLSESAEIVIRGTANYNGTWTIFNVTTDAFDITRAFVADDATGWWGIDAEGRNNTALGYNAGRSNITGSNNLFLGYNAGYTGTSTNLTNATCIGYECQVTASNALILGGTGANAVNVGIGTTEPGSLLQVSGNGLFGNNTTSDATLLSGSPYGSANSFLSIINATNNYGVLRLGNMTADAVSDGIGVISFHANAQSGGTYSKEIAAIQVNLDSSGTAGNRGGWMRFMTKSDNANISAEHMRITSAGNVGIGTASPGGGTGNSVLTLANSSVAPTALANTTHLYSFAGEGYWMDAAGNAALQTPHDLQTGKWIFSSTNVNTERTLRVEMEDLTKELDAILGGGYVFENGEAVYRGENILAGIDARLSEQGTIVSDLTLKTSENISTLQELQDSVDEQFDKISNFSSSLADKQISISNEIQNLNDQIANYNLRITSVEDLTVKLQEQIDELKKLANTELNLAQIEANKTDIEYLKLVLGLDRAENGSIHLLGNLESDGIVAGAFTVKIIDPEAKTIGEAEIKNGEKEVFVETKAVTESSKIFTSFSGNPNAYSWVEKGKDADGNYTGFNVMLSEPATKDAGVDWWIVEEK